MKFVTKNTFTFNLILLLVICICACKKESKYVVKEKPEVVISANDVRLNQLVVSLFSDTVYVINTDLDIKPTQTLKIAAGTLIKVNPAFSISIQEKGIIEAQGTASQPIVFTVNAFTGSQGGSIPGFSDGRKRLWSGLFINGDKTETNVSATSSGILSFVRIEFAGSEKNTVNSVSLFLKNVSNQTIINNIQVSYSETSSIKINGGNCNANNIVSYACQKTDVILENQYQGMLQNILCYKHPYFFTITEENAGLRINHAETFPTISNLTVIGPDNQKGYRPDAFKTNSIAINISDQSKFHISNSVVLGYPSGAFKIDNIESYDAFTVAGESSLTNSLFHSNIADSIFYYDRNIQPPVTSNDFKAYILKTELNNMQYLSSAAFALTNPYDYYGTNSPDPTPAAGSPLLQGANFDAPQFNKPFFKKVSYRGALGTGADNWLQGWTNFNPLQTNYNF